MVRGLNKPTVPATTTMAETTAETAERAEPPERGKAEARDSHGAEIDSMAEPVCGRDGAEHERHGGRRQVGRQKERGQNAGALARRS